MICPYCNKEMEKGVIPKNRHTLKWKPLDRTFIQSIFNTDHRNVILAATWDDEQCIAYLCRNCKKVIIEYE